MNTRLVQSQKRRTTPVRRINIVPLLAIVAMAALVATLVLLFPMDWARAISVTTSADHTIFSPNGDGNLDTAVVVYALSADATVDISVLDGSRSVVRRLMEGQSQASGQHSVVWDGLDQMGQVLPDGEYLLQIVARATVQSTSSTVRLHVDTEPPIIRLANLPDDMYVGADRRELFIEGVTDPEASVWLNDLPQPLAVSSSGGFRASYTLNEGLNRIELVAVDSAGNRASVTREITLLTEPPRLVISNPPDRLWINQQMLSVQGSVPGGVRVRVNQAEASVDAEGKFDVDVVLEQGENVIRIEAIDVVGNVSVVERRVYLLTRPPSLALTTVQNEMTVREPSLLVVGKTEPLVAVWLNGRELAVDSQGGFQGMVDLVEGQNLIRVEAVDRAGNTAVLVRRVVYDTRVTGAALPAGVGTVLMIAGGGVVVAIGLWLISGLWQRPLSLVLRVARSTLSPDGDGRFDPAIVMFEISRPATMTAEVWDANNQHVATLFNRQRRDRGEHLLVWDGRNSEGRLAPPGTYEVEVYASTLFNTVSSSTHLWVESGAARPVRAREQAREWERGWDQEQGWRAQQGRVERTSRD